MTGGAVGLDGLYREVDSPIHRLAPAPKLAATLLFVLAVVATPVPVVWAYALHALVVVVVATVGARLPLRELGRRLWVELPFVAFAGFLPLVGRGHRLDVLGLSLSVPGLWAAWAIVAKGTLGVAASVVLATTTRPADVIAGLDRLGMPRVVTAIAGFMIRYLGVVADQAHRLRVARLSRGDDPRWLWQARGVAATAGTLFVRSYERGERVHQAMVARGYTGSMPPPLSRSAMTTIPAGWAFVAPVVATVTCLAAWWSIGG